MTARLGLILCTKIGMILCHFQENKSLPMCSIKDPRVGRSFNSDSDLKNLSTRQWPQCQISKLQALRFPRFFRVFMCKTLYNASFKSIKICQFEYIVPLVYFIAGRVNSIFIPRQSIHAQLVSWQCIWNLCLTQIFSKFLYIQIQLSFYQVFESS